MAIDLVHCYVRYSDGRADRECPADADVDEPTKWFHLHPVNFIPVYTSVNFVRMLTVIS